jgi:hypothetical protein
LIHLRGILLPQVWEWVRPLWSWTEAPGAGMLLVGPPASGKTEILDALLGLQNMHPAGTLTEASLLSGVPRRERAQDASGGLLRAIGDFGYIVCKTLRPCCP